MKNSFTRDDGTPLNYTLVNITDWCKNTFEVVNQLRINTDYSHQRYDVTHHRHDICHVNREFVRDGEFAPQQFFTFMMRQLRLQRSLMESVNGCNGWQRWSNRPTAHQ